MSDSVITEEMRRMIGTEGKTFTVEIEKRMIRNFVEATGYHQPLWCDEEYAKKTKHGGIIAPPSFIFGLMMTSGGPEAVPRVESPHQRNLVGGNEWELYLPVKPGDVISVTNKLVDLIERQGKSGMMLIRIVETTWVNQKGELVAKGRQTFI